MITPSAAAQQKLIYGTLLSDGQRINDGVLATEGDRISYAGPAAGFVPPTGAVETRLDAGSLILPGLIDIHNHGAVGGDFPGGEEAGARKAIDFLHSSGTTTLLASMVTASEEDLLRGIELYVRLSKEGLLAGIHLEGPFLSEARCGAQDPAFLRAPDLELARRLIEAGEGKIVTMTYAPELEGAAALIDLLTSHGVTPSLGHTDSDAPTAAGSLAQAREGLAAAGFDGNTGRPTVTHLFNGMPPMHHRAPARSQPVYVPRKPGKPPSSWSPTTLTWTRRRYSPSSSWWEPRTSCWSPIQWLLPA